MEQHSKNILKIIVIVASFLLIIVGAYINNSREFYTAKILGLPEWTYIPFSISEHLFGIFALCMIFFSIYLSFERKPKTAKYIGLIVIASFSFFYEIMTQNLFTIWQLPFDILGLLGYWFYVKWSYDA